MSKLRTTALVMEDASPYEADLHRRSAPMTAAISVGVIGAGFVGAQHVEALRRLPGVHVAAVSASSSASAAVAAGRLGIERAAADARSIIDDRAIDVVHVCAPNDMHRELVLRALEAGKHVLCEKPLAVEADEARELVRAAGAADRVTVLCHNYRFYPMVAELRARVAAGAVGAVHTVRGHYLQDWLLLPTDANWRLDPARGGRSRAIADIGTHWLDLAEVVIGVPLEAVFAEVRTILPRRVQGSRPTFSGADGTGAEDAQWYDVATEDEASLVLRFAGGMGGSVQVSQVAAGHKNDLTLSVDGAAGSATWRQEQPDGLWFGRRDGASETLQRSASPGGGGRALSQLPAGHPEGWSDGLRNLFAATYAVIRGDVTREELPVPLPTFEDGLRHQLAVEAALESSSKGAWVTIPNSRAASLDPAQAGRVDR